MRGIAGLTAAYELYKAGQDVLVLEARNYAGGRMATVDWEGFRVDIGAKFVTTADKSLLSIVDEMGLSDQLVPLEDGLDISIYRDGQIHSANFLSIPSYLGWSGVSLRARLAMLKLLPHFLRIGKLDEVYHLERANGPDDPQTYEAFFKKHISEEMFEYWAAPMFETMCAYTGEDVSRKAFLALMVGYMNADSVGFRDGVGVLPEAIAGRLEVELTARVNSVRILSDGSGVEVKAMLKGAPQSYQATRLVVAVPGNHVLEMFSEPRPAWETFFSQVYYSTGALHYHIARSDFEPRVARTLIPRAENWPINAITFEKRLDGRWLILTDPSVYQFSAEDDSAELARIAQTSIRQVFPDFQGEFVGDRIFKWRDKLPTFRPGYLDALTTFWQEPQEDPIFFCGDYFAGPSTGAALFTGRECAQRLLTSL